MLDGLDAPTRARPQAIQTGAQQLAHPGERRVRGVQSVVTAIAASLILSACSLHGGTTAPTGAPLPSAAPSAPVATAAATPSANPSPDQGPNFPPAPSPIPATAPALTAPEGTTVNPSGPTIQAEYSGTTYRIRGGSLAGDPHQGVLMITTTSSDGKDHTIIYVDTAGGTTPAKRGALTANGADTVGNVFASTSEPTQDMASFNLGTDRFAPPLV